MNNIIFTQKMDGARGKRLRQERVLSQTQESFGGATNHRMVDGIILMIGLLTLHSLQAIPRSDWATTTAEQVMLPVANMKWVRPDTELRDALGEMDRDGVNQLPVMAGDQLQGVLGRGDVISLLHTTVELSRQ